MLWVILLVFLTPAQVSDLHGADVLLPMVEAETVLGDKAYDAQERVIGPLTERHRGSNSPEKK